MDSSHFDHSLVDLDLTNTPLTDKALEYIVLLTQLSSLSLAFTKISSKGALILESLIQIPRVNGSS